MATWLRWLPSCEVYLLLLVDVDPELLLGVISHALILLMKTIKGSTDNIILCLDWRAVQLDPLALFDEF